MLPPQPGFLSRILTHLSTPARWTDPANDRTAWGLWVVTTVVLCAMVVAKPDANSVTANYRHAALAWLEGRPMYAPGADGWLYPPQSAILYVPFAAPSLLGTAGLLLGECLWRVGSVGLLALSVFRLSSLANAWPRAPSSWFFVMTLLTLPGAIGSLRNGQANVPLAATIVLTFEALARARWWGGVGWVILGLMTKPLGVVTLLLAGAVHCSKLWWRLALGVGVFLLLPLVHTDWAYAVGQYRAGIAKMGEAASFDARRFADLGGMLETFGLEPSAWMMTAVRGVAALAVLGLVWLARRRTKPHAAAVVAVVLTACYLVLMNPRTEGNSYVILAPGAAALACLALFGRAARAHRRGGVIGWLLVGACVLLGTAHLVHIGVGKDYWIRPLVALVLAFGVAGWVVRAVWRAARAGRMEGDSRAVASSGQARSVTR
jgi:hypothetical protein